MEKELNTRQIMILSYILIIICSIFPLFFDFPFRINLFLAWEGAYRLYMGQVPFKDFGLPMGFGFWIVPAVFFKIFGPAVYTLVKAQVFINFISLLTFRSILRLLHVKPMVVFYALLVFCLSYALVNFWPWYNHSVFVYQLLGLNFLLLFMLRERKRWSYFYLFISAFFTVFAFFTKQDGGGLAVVFSFVLLIYHAIVEKRGQDVALFTLFVGLVGALFVLPFLNHGFLYWFNYGQPPHYSRISAYDILNEILGASQWIKFYLLCTLLILGFRLEKFKVLWHNKPEFLFGLITVGILLQAFIIQVTSYTPVDGNIYFHSFAFAFLFSHFFAQARLEKVYVFISACMLIVFWWSGVYWNRFLGPRVKSLLPAKELPEHVISKNTFIISNDTVEMDRANWVVSDFETFERVKLPEETIQGMKRLEALLAGMGNDIKVLNMSELTPLAHEFGFEIPKGQPLWFHQGVAIFQPEVDMLCTKIENQEYDIIMFEIIPDLNNFYPVEVHDCIRGNYQLHDKFLAPRLNEDSYIEVYRKP